MDRTTVGIFRHLNTYCSPTHPARKIETMKPSIERISPVNSSVPQHPRLKFGPLGPDDFKFEILPNPKQTTICFVAVLNITSIKSGHDSMTYENEGIFGCELQKIANDSYLFDGTSF